MKLKILIAAAAVIAVIGTGIFFTLDGTIGSQNIEYDLDGGVNSDLNPSNYGNETIYLQDPSKKGYSFDGWYKNEDLTDRVTALSPSDGQITIHAKWILNTYTIKYYLDGGTLMSDNPSTYNVEDRVVLNSPTKLMLTFNGWYTDQDLSLSSKVTDINDLAENVTLYAGYDTVVGSKYNYRISGTLAGENVSGTLSVSYSAYTNGQYLMVEEETMSIKIDGEVMTFPSYSSTTEKNGFLRDGRYDHTETITYQGREQSADVYRTTVGGMTGYDYLLNGSTVVRSTTSGTIDGEEFDLTFSLTNVSSFIPKDKYTVTIYYGNGLSSVSGISAYDAGKKVSLSAVTKPGVTFKGWCDKDENIYEESKTFIIDAIGSDVTFYALCEGDVSLSTPTSAVYSNPRWLVEEKYTGKYVTTAYGNPVICNLPNVGGYTCKFTGTNANGGNYTYTMDKTVDGPVKISYNWTYSGWSYGMEWTTSYSNYAYYKELNTVRRHTTDAQDSKFVTFTNYSISIISDFLIEESAGMNKLQRANFILQFVEDTITYQYDKDGVGYDEYWKYPIETLFEKRGDCEDTAILYASLMKAAGYDVALLRFDDHLAVGVVVQGAYGSYYNHDGKRYFYCETTGDTWSNWTVGEVPSDYKGKRAYVTVI